MALRTLMLESTLLLAGVGLIGCATMASGGTKQKITITTDPPGATVMISESCQRKFFIKETTPAKVTLPRRYAYHVIINKEGYLPLTLGIRKKVNWTIAGDLILLPLHGSRGGGTATGIVFSGIDHFTGAIWSLDPTEIKVKLQPIKTNSLEQPKSQ
ncbi:MAG: hypothetical protein AAB019_06920 [Planctomycetota bacterium]